jgi:hypothetical protein
MAPPDPAPKVNGSANGVHHAANGVNGHPRLSKSVPFRGRTAEIVRKDAPKAFDAAKDKTIQVAVKVVSLLSEIVRKDAPKAFDAAKDKTIQVAVKVVSLLSEIVRKDAPKAFDAAKDKTTQVAVKYVLGFKGSEKDIKSAREELLKIAGNDCVAEAIHDRIPALVDLIVNVVEGLREKFKKEAKDRALGVDAQASLTYGAAFADWLLTKREEFRKTNETVLINLPDFRNQRENFKKPLETVVLKAITNLGKAALKARNKSSSDNILLEIVAYIIRITRKHIIQITRKHIKGDRNVSAVIADIEKIVDPKVRDKKLEELLGPLMREILGVIFPNGAADLNLDYAGSVNSSHNPLSINYHLWGLINDPSHLVLLYKHLLEPTIVAAERKEAFEKTAGGRVLLHFTKLKSEQVVKLLLELCDSMGLTIGKLIFPAGSAANTNKVNLWQAWFGKSLSEIAKLQDPHLKPLRQFGEYWVECLATQLFTNLACTGKAAEVEEDPLRFLSFLQAGTGVVLEEGEDPVPYVIKALSSVLGDIYKAHGPKLKAHYLKYKKEYAVLQIKTLEYSKLLAKPKNPDPILEAKHQDAIKELCKWHDAWEMSPERMQLIQTVFVPMMHDLIPATGIGHRLKILGLEQEILRGIPIGLCFLFELAVVNFPGLAKWLDPDTMLKRREVKLVKDPLGEACKAYAEGSALLTEAFLPDVLRDAPLRKLLAEEMVVAIDKQQPENLHFSDGVKAYLCQLASDGILYLAEQDPKTDPVWRYASTQIRSVVSGVFIRRNVAYGNDHNPIASIVMDGIGIVNAFAETKLPEIRDELAKLSLNPSEEELEPVYKIFREELIQKLLEIEGFQGILDNDGILTIFYLNEKCIHLMARKAFQWYKALSTFEGVNKEGREHLRRTLYDEKAYLVTLQTNTDVSNVELQEILKDRASLEGKTSEQLAEIWKRSGTEEAAQFVENIYQLISGRVLPKTIKGNASTIAEKLLVAMGLSKGGPKQEVLAEAIALIAHTRDVNMRKAWEYFKGWLTIVMNQGATNVIATTSHSMPQIEGQHRLITLAGDVAARVTRAAARCLGRENVQSQDSSSVVIEVEEDVPIKERGARLARDLLSMAAPHGVKESPEEKTQPILKGLPISQENKEAIWNKVVAASEELVNDAITVMTPDVAAMKERLHEIFGNDNMDAFCRKMADFIGQITPISMDKKSNETGRLLFDSMRKYLEKYKTGPEKALFERLLKNHEFIQEFFVHNVGQIGGNQDKEEALKKTLWPTLQQYTYPILLSMMLKMSETVEKAERDPQLSLKLFKGFLGLMSKQLQMLNKVTEESQRGTADKVSALDMAIGFKGEYDTALRLGIGLPEEEAQEVEYSHFFLPEAKRLFKLIGFTKTDLPVPDYMQDIVFGLMSESIGPFVMNLSFGTLFFGDGQEDTFNKMEIIMWDNMQLVLDAVRSHVAPEDAAELDEDEEPPLDEDLVIECGKMIKELVNLLPVPILKGVMSNKSVHDLSARQWGRAFQRISKEWPLRRMMNDMIVVGTQNIGLPEDPKVHAKKAEAREEEAIIKRAGVTTDGVMIMIQKFFEMICSKVEDAIVFVMTKILGKQGQQFGKELVGIIRYVGRIVSWILYPLHLLISQLTRLITQQFMKKQANLFHQVRNHPVNKSLMFRLWKCFASIMEKAVKETK